MSVKQKCSWCGRDRKPKHFSNGSGDCNDCANQKANGRLAGSGCPQCTSTTNPMTYGGPECDVCQDAMWGGPGLGAQHAMINSMFTQGPNGVWGVAPGGGIPGPLPFAPPKPPKKKKEPTGPVYKAVEDVATFVEGGLVKRIEMQLEFGMNDQGMPLSEAERLDLQKQYAKLTFQSEQEVDEDEEAAVLRSILGATDEDGEDDGEDDWDPCMITVQP